MNGDSCYAESYDYVYGDTTNYCRQKLIVKFSRNRKKVTLTGYEIYELGGNHILMKMNLHYKNKEGIEVLWGATDPSYPYLSFISEEVKLEKINEVVPVNNEHN